MRSDRIEFRNSFCCLLPNVNETSLSNESYCVFTPSPHSQPDICIITCIVSRYASCVPSKWFASEHLEKRVRRALSTPTQREMQTLFRSIFGPLCCVWCVRASVAKQKSVRTFLRHYNFYIKDDNGDEK